MAEAKPKKERNITGLALGRGKRPKLDNPVVAIRMSSETKEALEKIAEAYGIRFGGKPHLGGLLAQIAEGKLFVARNLMSPETRESLEKIAKSYSIVDLDGLFIQIAEGKLLVVPAPPKQP